MKNSKELLLLVSCLAISNIGAEDIEKPNVIKLAEYGTIELTNANGDPNIFYALACNCDNRNYEVVTISRVKPFALAQDVVTEVTKLEYSLKILPPELAALAVLEAGQELLEQRGEKILNDVLDKAGVLLAAQDQNGKTAEDILKEKLENFDSKSSGEQIQLAGCKALALSFTDLKAVLQEREELRKMRKMVH